MTVSVTFGTSEYSSLLVTWYFQVNPSDDLSSQVKQPSIVLASVSMSVQAAFPYRKTDSTVERNRRVLVFLDRFDLRIRFIFLCVTHARPILFVISALELLTWDPK